MKLNIVKSTCHEKFQDGVNAPKKIHLNVYICNVVQLFVVRYGVTANITAFHAVARGSIPRTGIF